MKAIIIQGPQGSGKTKLAKLMANMAGLPYAVITASEINTKPFALAEVLVSEPKTIIVEEFVTDDAGLSLAKSLVSSKEMEIPVKNHGIRIVKTPNFIFCSGNKNPLNTGVSDRRFEVINLTK